MRSALVATIYEYSDSTRDAPLAVALVFDDETTVNSEALSGHRRAIQLVRLSSKHGFEFRPSQFPTYGSLQCLR